MKSILLFVLASAIIFKLSSTSENVNGCCSGIFTGKTKPALCKSYTTSEDMPIAYLRQTIEKNILSESRKTFDWELWLRKQKKEMIDDFEKEHAAWLKNKNEAFNNFLNRLEEKWSHYNPRMHEEYQTDLYDVCSNWSDDEWIEWFRTRGLDYIISDFESWFNENISSYNKIMTSKLINWSKTKKYKWNSDPYRFYEERYWVHWNEKALHEDPDIYIKVSSFLYWVKRRKNEKKQWDLLIKRIDKKYVDNNNPKLTQWCIKTMGAYNNWLTSFYINWIENKYWNWWIIEKKMK
ncbi:tryptophan-rich protein [Plasmodium malariae]|uniref:Tryptophan-rich protein n=1 Tax=Plasmodium malariae TaxID=5858 RepID=A0A1D3JHQ2_PLAMA|nr:tryptophan-rich protein [Plasmodium malariae]SBT85715.1 tryptophan-rich protein [Plasmodium malariae]